MAWDAAKQRDMRAKFPERYREYDRRKRLNNPESTRRRVRRALRKFRGMPTPLRPEPQPPVCECCARDTTGDVKSLSLDHDHATGKFRGWLCHNCNLGIGRLGDTIEALERALQYLKKNG